MVLRNGKRTHQQLLEHYEIEKKLASQLRNASREERQGLYNVLYDELYRRVSHHPQLARKGDSKLRLLEVSRQMKFLRNFLDPSFTFLEVGPGDCSLSLEIAKHVEKVYAIDVSKEITKGKILRRNFELIVSNGCSIPVPETSIDIAYSRDVMEHLHPDDALDQLQDLFRCLTHGGKYICITPNQLSGPHDVSRYFDNVATGFHLREYTLTELCDLFHNAGFSKMRTYIGGQGVYVRFPLLPITICERLLGMLSSLVRRRIAKTLPFKALLGITIVGTKL